MGLDMYLRKRSYVQNWEHNEKDGIPEWDIKIKHYGKNYPKIKPERICYIEEEVMYWRKSNAIHKWFVDNLASGVDECQPIDVSSNDLINLRDLCKEVLDKVEVKKGVIQNGSSLQDGEWVPNFEPGEMIMNAEEIEKILPTSSGFFFGSTNYEQWYLEDIKQTYEKLNELLSEDPKAYYIYQASW